MNKLSNIDISILQPSEIKAIEAYSCKQIRDYSLQQLNKPIHNLIVDCHVFLGRSDYNKEDAELLKNLFAVELKENFKTFTVEEIIRAVRLGVKGELFDLSTLNVSPICINSFIKYIRVYNEKIRRPAIAEFYALEEKEKKKAEEKEKEQKTIEFEAKIENALKLGPEEREKINIGVRAAMYRHLQKKGKVNLSLEEKNVIFEKAKTMADEVSRRDYNFASDFLNGLKNRDAQIIDIAQGLAFLII